MNFADLGRAVARANAIRFHGHEPHSHDVPHLVYIVSGTGKLDVDGRTVLLRAHQSAWLAADVEHSLELSDDGMALGPFLDSGAVPPGGRTRILGQMRDLDDLMLVLLCVAPESDEERDPFRSAIEQVLRAVTREQFPLTLPEHPVAHAIALEAPYFDGTLSELAQRHFTSVRHVQRLFLEETGLPFARWRTRARLNVAIVNLRAGQGMRTAMLESGYTTKHGLLKAVSRECGLPLEELLSAPQRTVELLDEAA